MKGIVALILLASPLYGGECLPAKGDRIYARDLALADSSFAGLPGGRVVGFAPAPGVKRVFTASDLRSLARANGVASAASEDVCFAIPMRPIERHVLLASMRPALPPETDLRLIEVPAGDFPAGDFEFPLTALEPPAPGAGNARIWRGSIRYGDTLHARVWARVELRRRVSVVVAAMPISRNAPIVPSQLGVATVSIPFGQERGFARGIEEVIGSIAKLEIAAGAPVLTADLEKPLAVRRGDPVPVEVQSGRARIRMEAIAEISARSGEQLELRNPSSGKVFHARLEGGGKAVIVVGGRQER